MPARDSLNATTKNKHTYSLKNIKADFAFRGVRFSFLPSFPFLFLLICGPKHGSASLRPKFGLQWLNLTFAFPCGFFWLIVVCVFLQRRMRTLMDLLIRMKKPCQSRLALVTSKYHIFQKAKWLIFLFNNIFFSFFFFSFSFSLFLFLFFFFSFSFFLFLFFFFFFFFSFSFFLLFSF